MRGFTVAIILLALAPSAQAKEPSIWIKCDGLPKPDNASTSAVKFAASTTLGLFGLPQSQREEPASTGADGVAACSAAFAELTGDRAWARQVNMLRARALHHVEAKDEDSALIDLRSANDIAGKHGNEVFFQRSVGVASILFEAALLGKKGKQAEANRMAVAASDMRPYSQRIAILSAAILALDTSFSDGEMRVLDRVAKYHPRGLLPRAEFRARAGDAAGAAEDYGLILKFGLTSVSADLDKATGGKLRDPVILAQAALANARASRVTEAAALFAELKAISMLPDKAEKDTEKKFSSSDYQLNYLLNGLRSSAMKFQPLIEATLLERRGDPVEAANILFRSRDISDRPATLELLRRLSANPATAAKIPPSMVGEIEQAMKAGDAKSLTELDMLTYAKALPSLEQEGRGNTYKAQASAIVKLLAAPSLPSGYTRNSNGKPDDVVREITFSGGSSLPISEELAILRAADVARHANATGLLIEKREDIRRLLVATTTYGAETSRMPAVFETTLSVRFLDKDAPEPGLVEQKSRIIDVDDAWSSLSAVFAAPKK